MKKNLVKAVLAAVLGFSLIFAGCTTDEDGSIVLPDGTTITTPSDDDKSDSTDSSTDSEKTDTDSSSTDSEKTDTDSSSTDSEKTDTETTVEEGSVKVTVNVDGSVSCGKCGKTYELKSEADSCTHYVCETCGSTYYSQTDLEACSAHVTVIFTEADGVTDGNETVTKVIKSGKTVTAPEWEKEGFTLSWLTSEGKEFDFDDELNVADGETSKTVTLTAKWTTAYTVTFKDSDGTNADVTVTVTSGETIESGDIPSWTKDHYTLTWTSSVADITTDSAITGDVTFTATWTEDTNYTVTFKDADGGENAEVTQKVYEGEKASVPAWTKENYTLAWTSSVEGVTTDSAITSDVTFTAVWTENAKYTVTFKDADGGTNAEVTQTVYTGNKATVPEWTNDGCTLSWTSSVTGLTPTSAITADVTFTAVWTEKPTVVAGTYNITSKGIFSSQNAGATQTVSGITVTCKIDSNGANLKTSAGEVTFTIKSAMTLTFTDSSSKGVVITTTDGYIGTPGILTSGTIGSDGSATTVTLGAGSYTIAGATKSSAKIASLTFAEVTE